MKIAIRLAVLDDAEQIQATYAPYCRTPISFEVESPSIAEMDQARGCHAGMARKYRHAARYPWLSVEPDPLDSGP